MKLAMAGLDLDADAVASEPDEVAAKDELIAELQEENRRLVDQVDTLRAALTAQKRATTAPGYSRSFLESASEVHLGTKPHDSPPLCPTTPQGVAHVATDSDQEQSKRLRPSPPNSLPRHSRARRPHRRAGEVTRPRLLPAPPSRHCPEHGQGEADTLQRVLDGTKCKCSHVVPTRVVPPIATRVTRLRRYRTRDQHVGPSPVGTPETRRGATTTQ